MRKLIFCLFIVGSVTQSVYSQGQPKHDAAASIIELNCLFPAGNAGFGGDFRFDVLSVRLVASAVRLNFGLGGGVHTAKEVIRSYGDLILADGSIARNYLKDNRIVPDVNVYTRLWVRVLNPLEVSLVGGVMGYSESRSITAYFSEHAYGNNKLVKRTELNSEEANSGIGYFYELKLMINFRMWGVSGGITQATVGQTYSVQPVAGLWIGASRSKRKKLDISY